MATATTSKASTTDAYKNAKLVQDSVSKALSLKGKKYSDIVSKAPADSKVEELQWVDLVTAGGGMLGVGLLGYTYVLEQAGIRFIGLGGTSAGAINTILMATSRAAPDEPCSLNMLDIMTKMEFLKFLDGPLDDNAKADEEALNFTMEGVAMIRAQTPAARNHGGPLFGLVNFLRGIGGAIPVLGRTARALTSPVGKFVIRNLPTMTRAWAHRGFHRGNAFEQWLADNIAPVKTVAELNDKLNFPTSLKLKAREGAPGLKYGAVPKQGVLKIVAADITTQTRAVFPEDAGTYWANGEVNPAAFVRASMSIPFFFLPFEVSNLPRRGESAAQKKYEKIWKTYNGTIPDKVTFVDGGMMSNFPMDLFNRPSKVPLYPTFGVQLGSSPDAQQDTSNPAAMLGSMIDSSRHIMDRTYLDSHEETAQVIGKINTDKFYWLDFNMSLQDRVDLFAEGAKAAADFLEGFDWKKYREYRDKLQEAKNFWTRP